jgi:hypothetical protein
MELKIALRGIASDRSVEMLPAIEEDLIPHGPRLPDIPDPTLASGHRLQIEWAVDGLRAAVQRQVLQNGESRVDEFWSSYRPWRERWIVGTGNF